jgi:methionyl-tRNA synthetase
MQALSLSVLTAYYEEKRLQFVDGPFPYELVELFDPAWRFNFSYRRTYDNREFGKAVKEIMALADKCNKFVDDYKPWLLAKDPEKSSELHSVAPLALSYLKY